MRHFEPKEPGTPPLSDLRVIDLSTVLAGPGCARYLADFGADVIKVEHPATGDSLRNMSWRHPSDGTSLFWKLVNRGKRCITLDLKNPDDLVFARSLIEDADVLVENFRPGKLEALGLDPVELIARNPRLVVTRVTGFGQTGPYAHRPGFATIAEAMSGFAAINGEPDGAPLLPPIALTDEVTALAAAFATMVALHSGVGQIVDVNLLESLYQFMGPLPSAYALHGYLQPRLGSGISYTVPRNTYRTNDDKWVAVSTSSDSVAARVMALIGCGNDPRFATFEGRVEHRAEIDRLMSEWIGQRTLAEVLAAFESAEAAAAPVYSMADIANDPHFAFREATTIVDDTPMQGLIARLSRTPGVIRWAGRPLGADNDEVRAEFADRHASRTGQD
ncbi:MAG: CoA transferase [Acidimicrobiales bacterium]|nr:CoA transferase [Acidimicrobiales bacterium]